LFIGWIALLLSFQIFWGKTGFLEYLAIFIPFIGIRVEMRNIALSLLVSVLSFFLCDFNCQSLVDMSLRQAWKG